jgi:hypothetical protein
MSSVASAINPVPYVSHAYDWVTGSDPSLPPPDDTAAAPASAGSDQAATDQNPSDEASGDVPAVPTDQRPNPPSFDQRQKIAQGLVADRTHAQDQLAEAQRQGGATRPLNPGQEEGGAASAPPLPDASSDTDSSQPRIATARPGPAPAPAASAQQRPMQAAASTTVSGSLQDVYRQRLAQFDRTTVASADGGMADPAHSPPIGGDAYSLQLAMQEAADTDGGMRLPRGVHSLDAFSKRRIASSFQVATLNVGSDAGDLTAGDAQALHDVAQLYRQQSGGVVRIVGAGAAAAARQLIRLGVPPARIYAGASDASGDMMVASATTIYVAY